MTTVNRLATLARAEWLQFRRNKVILFMAIVIPLGMPLLMWLNLGPDSGTDKQLVGAGMMELYLMMSLLMVLFYSVLSMATTRRDEGVLKRLRTGEARDGEILASIAVPGAAIVTVFFLVMAGILIGAGSSPVNFVLVLAALLIGLVVYASAALLTCCFTKNAEAAQLTSMPVMVLAVLSMSTLRASLPTSIARIVEVNPFAFVVDLASLGWAGIDPGSGKALASTEVLAYAGRPLALSAMWIVVLVWSAVIYMRWDTHRG